MANLDLIDAMPKGVDQKTWQEWFDKLSDRERKEIHEISKLMPRVAPMDGPQRMAFNSKAKILGYGGASGGGKSALIALLAVLSHQRTLVVRYDAKQLRALIEDIVEFYGSDT